MTYTSNGCLLKSRFYPTSLQSVCFTKGNWFLVCLGRIPFLTSFRHWSRGGSSVLVRTSTPVPLSLTFVPPSKSGDGVRILRKVTVRTSYSVRSCTWSRLRFTRTLNGCRSRCRVLVLSEVQGIVSSWSHCLGSRRIHKCRVPSPVPQRRLWKYFRLLLLFPFSFDLGFPSRDISYVNTFSNCHLRLSL